MITIDSTLKLYKTTSPIKLKLQTRTTQRELRLLLVSFLQSLIQEDLFLQAEIGDLSRDELSRRIGVEYDEEEHHAYALDDSEGEGEGEKVARSVTIRSANFTFPYDVLRKQSIIFITPSIVKKGYDTLLALKTTTPKLQSLLLSHLTQTHSMIIMPLNLTTNQCLQILDFVLLNIHCKDWESSLGYEVEIGFDLQRLTRGNGVKEISFGVNVADLRKLREVSIDDDDGHLGMHEMEDVQSTQESSLLDSQPTQLTQLTEPESTADNKNDSNDDKEKDNTKDKEILASEEETHSDDKNLDLLVSPDERGDKQIGESEPIKSTNDNQTIDDKQEEPTQPINHRHRKYPIYPTPTPSTTLSNLLRHITNITTLQPQHLPIFKLTTDLISISANGRLSIRKGGVPKSISTDRESMRGVGFTGVECVVFLWGCCLST